MNVSESAWMTLMSLQEPTRLFIQQEAPEPWPDVTVVEEVPGLPAYTDGFQFVGGAAYTSVRMYALFKDGHNILAPRSIITPEWKRIERTLPIVQWLRGEDVDNLDAIVLIRERNEELRVVVYTPRDKDINALKRTWRRQKEVRELRFSRA